MIEKGGSDTARGKEKEKIIEIGEAGKPLLEDAG